MIQPLTVNHQGGQYPILFGRLADLWPTIQDRDVRVVTDSNVLAAWGASIPEGMATFVAPPGEHTKSLDHFGAIHQWLVKTGATRNTLLIALGGGVIGDLAGFVAATYMRGIEWVQVPTTLLAQVDSSVGGKVAIDLPGAKNMVGSFYPPQRVHVALETLETLPDRQRRNGMAEVLKYGFIADPSLLSTTQYSEVDGATIRRCLEIKAEVVEADELDLTGRRAILNFGHTVGHAIEAAQNYEGFLHGEAIAIGMAVEAELAVLLGLAHPDLPANIRAPLQAAGLPVRDSILKEEDKLLAMMASDKKRTASGLAFSLVPTLGECKLVFGVPEEVVREALRKA